jgi:hypothetical protein
MSKSQGGRNATRRTLLPVAADHFPKQNSPTGHSNGITRVDVKYTKRNEYILDDLKKNDLNLFQ